MTISRSQDLTTIADTLGQILCPQGDSVSRERAIEDWLAQISIADVDDASCEAFYARHGAPGRRADQFEVRHILFLLPSADTEQRSLLMQQALTHLDDLRAGRQDFADLARRRSDCPSAAQGGYLGWVEAAQMVPEWHTPIRSAALGLLAAPISSRYGVHLVEVLQRRPGAALSPTAAREAVRDHLRRRRWVAAVEERLQSLWMEADVHGVPAPVLLATGERLCP